MKTNFLRVLGFAAALCLFTVFAQAVAPVVGNYKVYYGSLHNHCNISDGSGTPSDAYDYAKNTAKLDFFGLADHSTVMTSSQYTSMINAANSYNQDGIFAAFYGFEWTTLLTYGHVAVINTPDYVSSLSVSSFTGLVSWLNSREGVAFFNHPGWEATAFNEFMHFTSTPNSKFVGIELWNGSDGFNVYYDNDGYFSGDGNKSYYDEALVRNWKIGASGAEDNHGTNWGTAVPYQMGVLANNLTRSEIYTALKAKRFFSTLDKDIALSFKIAGAEMGSTVPGGSVRLQIDGSDGSLDAFSLVTLKKNGAVFKTWSNFNSTIFVDEYIDCSSGDYLYVVVNQLDGGRAITSPIWISGTTNQSPTVSLSSSAGGSSVNTGQTVTFTATASDPDGTISKVEFYQGSTLVSTDNAAPYEYLWTASSTGSYTFTAKAWDNLSATATSAPVTINVTVPNNTTLNRYILNGSDDAEQYQKGTVLLNDADIDLVYDSRTSGYQTVGLYFRNLNVPAGATITKAYIQFTACKKATATCNLTVKAEKSLAPASFTTATYNLSTGRTTTTAFKSWSPLAWSSVGAAGAAQQTPDLIPMINEVSNNGAVAINQLVFLITGTVGTRTAYSFETSSTKSACLHLEFTAPAASSQEELKSLGVPVRNPSSLSDQPVQAAEIQLYPNPVTDKLNLRISGEDVIEQLGIYSIQGALVDQIKVEGRLQETSVDCTGLIPGTYMLMVKTDRGNYPLKFVKQ